ncbi:hypothetical protein Nepgr_015467 [Nepenthes gracilis]|uniref:Uncharacterized protein n=1 Tax=Nepenthes gracilis TaxID=150966 RepID=A0AAD3SNK9_NEPGR|nr:hypothetical protein Nepgr_015467 [Nepenthes gracilis]
MRIGVAEFVVASEQSPSLQFLEANGGGHSDKGLWDKVEVDFLRDGNGQEGRFLESRVPPSLGLHDPLHVGGPPILTGYQTAGRVDNTIRDNNLLNLVLCNLKRKTQCISSPGPCVSPSKSGFAATSP